MSSKVVRAEGSRRRYQQRQARGAVQRAQREFPLRQVLVDKNVI